MFLYLLLNLGSISIPFVYSFEKNMRFIRYWKEVALSLSIVSMIFLIWDAIFTANGVWGFNADYHLNILIFKMPIEEWMFFFCIPYASFFIHYSFEYFLPNFKLGEKVLLDPLKSMKADINGTVFGFEGGRNPLSSLLGVRAGGGVGVGGAIDETSAASEGSNNAPSGSVQKMVS